MGKGLFITGTDTGVGKTVVGGLLAVLLRRQGINVGVMKPIESGCPRRDGALYPQDAHYLKMKAESQDPLEEIIVYALELPAAPAAASRHAGVQIELDRIVERFRTLSRRHQLTLVEGAGGLLVPLTRDQDNSHLILALGIPALVVARAFLGTINHTLLTLRWAEHVGIEVCGVIVNHLSPELSEAEKENLAALLERLRVPFLGEVPYLGGPDRVAEDVTELERRLDLGKILA